MSDSVTCLCTGRNDVVCTAKLCTIAGAGAPGELDSCRICWLAGKRRPDDVRAPNVPAPVRPAVRMDCTHRGERLPDLLACSTCKRGVKLKTYACELHEVCTLDGTAEGAACCASCPDYSSTLTRRGALKWSYGVTTVASRRKYPLPRTLKSLGEGGFDAPRLFVDGGHDGTSWADEFKLPVTCRGGEPARVVANWVLSMLELYYREPFADRYALFQDDLVCYKNLRGYLDASPYPENGYLNLYTFPENQHIAPRETVGWFEGVILNRGQDPTRYQKGLGAVALVFSNLALRTLFTHPGLFDKPKHPSYGKIKIDGGVVNAMNCQGWREYVHSPSLVQHTGVVTSRVENTRVHPEAPNFLGENYNALDLLKEPARATR